MEGIQNKAKNFLIKLFATTVIISVVSGFIGGVIFGFTFNYFDRPSKHSLENPQIIRQQETENEFDTESVTIRAVEAVSPSVVSIIVEKDVRTSANSTGPNIFPFDDFEDFFNFRFPEFQEPDTESDEDDFFRQQVGGGSGFIVTEDGIIVTNRHVVSDDDAFYTVLLNDGRQFEATILARDSFNDIAIIRIEADSLPTAPLGNSDSIRIGQSVIAIGNALGEFSNSVTKGIVSGIDRRVVAGDGFGQSEVIEEAIQTDAAINPGNSGGPLINLSGEVIGVNTAISRSGQLVGFAIPINTAKRIAESVIEHGRIVRPWLGVRYILNNKRIMENNNFLYDYGALIISDDPTEPAVVPGTPAESAGLKTNDLILEVDGKRVDGTASLGTLIGKYSPGDTVELTIIRDGERIALTVTLGEFPYDE